MSALAVGDQGPCTEEEFIQAGATTPPGSSLVNRHKYCLQTQSLNSVLSVDLMQTSAGSPWQYYSPGVPAWQVRTFDVGTIAVRTRVQAYGPSTVLAKTFKIDAAATYFAFAPEFPDHLKATISVMLTPDASVDVYSGTGIGNLQITAGAINPITLSGSAASGSTGAFSVQFGWTYSGSNRLQEDFVELAPFVPRWIYSVRNTPRAGTTEPFRMDADSSASPLDKPRVRCDRRVASESSGFTQGCVFSEASAIMELSKTDVAVAEAAEHIESAQRTSTAYKPRYSPGVFVAAAGTRAIANESGGDQYVGLIRGESPDNKKNRDAACERLVATSLVNVRPHSGSASCLTSPPPSTCSCDEYPFAMTKNGAYYNADGTSVRYILKTHNSSSAGTQSETMNRQRVFRGEKFWVRVIP